MTLTPLITAEEGFPAFERLAASATSELLLAFRVIDPDTKLRAPELREQGLDDWSDLIAMLGERGVRLRLLISDFDPLFTSDLHRKAWASATRFAEKTTGDVQVLCAPHGQKAGKLWHFAMAPRLFRARKRLRQEDPSRLTPVQEEAIHGKPVLRPVTLHHKFIIADRTACVVGGLDVNERRYDTNDHDQSPEETWHDVATQVDDPGYSEALTGHFATCWNAAITCGAASLANRAETWGEDMPVRKRSGNLRLLQTYATPCNGAARLGPMPRASDHAEELPRLFNEAQRYIYIETQFLRHAPLADTLCELGRARPDLQLMVLLPMAPERVLFEGDHGFDARHAHGLQVRAIENLQKAFGDRLAVVSPAQDSRAKEGEPNLKGAGPIYVHAKVSIVDDKAGVIGSANLNGRSLLWDTEASVLYRDEEVAKGLMDRLADKWLVGAPGDPRKAQTWRDRARENANLAPEDRKGFLMPFPMERARRFSRLLTPLPDDMF